MKDRGSRAFGVLIEIGLQPKFCGSTAAILQQGVSGFLVVCAQQVGLTQRHLAEATAVPNNIPPLRAITAVSFARNPEAFLLFRLPEAAHVLWLRPCAPKLIELSAEAIAGNIFRRRRVRVPLVLQRRTQELIHANRVSTLVVRLTLDLQ